MFDSCFSLTLLPRWMLEASVLLSLSILLIHFFFKHYFFGSWYSDFNENLSNIHKGFGKTQKRCWFVIMQVHTKNKNITVPDLSHKLPAESWLAVQPIMMGWEKLIILLGILTPLPWCARNNKPLLSRNDLADMSQIPKLGPPFLLTDSFKLGKKRKLGSVSHSAEWTFPTDQVPVLDIDIHSRALMVATKLIP